MNEVTIQPDMKMNIFELIAGARFRINNQFIIDPFAGFRYSSYQVYGSVDGLINETSFDEKSDFWDPVLGVQMHYYPHPKVPILFKTDIGGFGAGSEFSWAASINSGYSISPSLDLLAGFSAYGSNYENEVSARDKNVGLDIVMYGFDLGLKYHIPKRYRDPSIFKKEKK